MIIILLLGLFLSSFEIKTRSLDFDESASIIVATQSWNEFFPAIQNFENNPPLYYILLKISSIFDNLVIYRLLSILLFLGTILFTFKIGEKVFDSKTGLLSAFLMSSSTFLLFFAQNIRNYMLSAFVTTLCLFAYFSLIEKYSKKNRVIFLISIIIGIYSSYFFIFVLLLIGLHFLIYVKNKNKFKKDILYSIPIIIISYLPWLGFFLNQLTTVSSGFWISEPSLQELFSFIILVCSGEKLTVFFIPILIYSLLIAFKKKKMEKEIFFTALFIIPILIIFIYSKVSTPLFLPRYFILFTPGLYLLVAKGISEIKMKELFIGILCVIIIISSLNFSSYNNNLQTGMSEASEYIKEYSEHTILHETPNTFFPEMIYNGKSVNRKILNESIFIGHEFIPKEHIITSISEVHSEKLIIISDNYHKNKEIEEFIENNCFEKRIINKINLYECKSDNYE